MSKITYSNKIALNVNSDIADVNKCNASDLNEIKNVVNENDDNTTNNSNAIGNLSSLNTTNKNNLVGAINEVDKNCKINDETILGTNEIIEITPLVGQNHSNYGNTYYYKVGSIVYLHIGLKGLTANTENVIFTLPSGYRPRGYVSGYGISDNLSSTAVTQISKNGDINIRPSSAYALIDISFVAMN